MDNRKIRKTMQGAVILSAAALIAKILSAFYRIPFQNIVGNAGFYVYQQVYPIYGIGMTFALSGFPVYISKLIAEQDSDLHRIQLSRQIFVVLACFGVLAFSCLQLLSGPLAALMGDNRLDVLIRSVSWMFLFMPFLAVPRGYHQGVFDMIPPALSQVVEQFVRVAVIIACAVMFSRCHWSLYRMGAGAMLGSSFGALFAVLCLSPFYFRKFFRRSGDGFHVRYGTLFRRLFTEGLVLCLFASMMVLLQLVDSFTVMKALRASGLSLHQAQNVKGAYDRAQPLVQLGMALATGFSASLLPALSRELAEGDHDGFRQTTRVILRISTTVAMAASCGMIAIMPELNTMLFGDAFLSPTISVYVAGIVLITLIGTYNSILQSMNCIARTVTALAFGILAKACTNSLLVRHFGITGASVSTLLALLMSLVLIVRSAPDSVGGMSEGKFPEKLLFVSLTMTAAVRCLMVVIEKCSAGTRLGACLAAMAGIVVGGFVFVSGAVMLGLLEREEWLAFPAGSRICSVIEKIRK